MIEWSFLAIKVLKDITSNFSKDTLVTPNAPQIGLGKLSKCVMDTFVI